MKLISVELIGCPKIEARAILPYEDAKDKNKKQFQVLQGALLKVIYKNKNNKEIKKIINAPRGYIYDGATIPFKIGKGNMKLLIPSLFHDLMCEDKSLINYNRNLSSLIFRELLTECGINKIKAQVMYLAVDNFQKFMKGWK
ncbi:MAG: DUF1353 domain-containing protein [Candidatus Gastranaerophilales bacterium]|nr:DUF1353 domain-containing protein [Candidatus Gastranaerophilales bacterium]